MQNRTLLSDIDFVPAKHGINVGRKPSFFGQCNQEPQRLVGNPVL
jgi:hypothetical protein